MAARPFSVRLAAALAFLAAGAPLVAHATQDFPSVVEAHYGLNAAPVDPPTGCRLCHDNDDMGGDPTTLRPFGRLLYTQFNVQPYDDGSLRTALGELDTQYMNLGDDIATGKDPNNDLAGGEGGAALNLDPVPTYGCAVAPGSRPGGSGAAGIVAVCAALAVYRPKRRIKPSQPRAR